MQRDDEAIISKSRNYLVAHHILSEILTFIQQDFVIMNRSLMMSLALISTTGFAHEPYVAPVAYKTEQTQVPVIAGYAEEALNSEYALKDAKLTVITPKNELKTVNSEALNKSATVLM